MCGIFALLYDEDDRNINDENISKTIMKGQKRGPENSVIETYKKNSSSITFGFHRLAINGLNEVSNQPISHNKLKLICNGEIYNFKQLFESFKIVPKTNSDCEIITCLYDLCKMNCVSMLDGVFSFIIYDEETNQVCVARDPYGVRPLYECYYENNHIGFSSDLEPLCFQKIKYIRSFLPGSYSIYNVNPQTNKWNMIHHEQYFFNNSYLQPYIPSEKKTIEFYMYTFVEKLKSSIKKRVENCERTIASLLSGGLDSSIVSAYVSKFYKEKTGQILETYSIGLKDAEDLTFSKQVSSFINSNHNEIIMTNDDFINSIPNVIKDIESYDTTTVRASVGNWNIGKYIKENSDAKVIFNGDGADELAGGYLYFHLCPNNEEFDKECKRLLKDIHIFDVKRSDKCISSHGLEPRTPFLDKEMTRFYLSIPIEYRNHTKNNQCEKYFIRKSIEIYDSNLLPKEILWRKKEAFSDGVSSQNKSWFEIIQDYIEECQNTQCFNNTYTCNIPKTKEQKYYRELFRHYFPDKCDELIPYFWMPKYVSNSYDASARTLDIYNKKS